MDSSPSSATSGSGMNSSWSSGGSAKRPAFQSSLAWLIRSRREETKFQKTWRGPSSGAPPQSMTWPPRSERRVARDAGAQHVEGRAARAAGRRGSPRPRRHRAPRSSASGSTGIAPPGARVDVGIDGRAVAGDRRGRAPQAAHHHPGAGAVALDHRQLVLGDMLEGRVDLLLGGRQARARSGCRSAPGPSGAHRGRRALANG